METSQKAIKTLEKQVSPLLLEADKYNITSVEEVDEASTFLKKVRDTERNLEAKRLEFTAPLNQSLKAINDSFKQLKAPLVQARELLTGKILTWKRAENDRLIKEEARRRAIQDAHEKAGHEVKAPVVLERPEAKIGNTQTRNVWTYEVTDFSKLSDDFKLVNNVAINQGIRDGLRNVLGLRIYQDERLSIVRR